MANFSGSHENPEPQQRSARPRFVGEATIRIEAPLVVPGRRSVPVTPVEARWIIKRCSADLTSRSPQGLEGHACRARPEGRTCHARRGGIDNPTLYGGRGERVPPSGPDKQVPPKGKSEGPACRAREIGMDCQKGHFADLPIGLIKHTPPT